MPAGLVPLEVEADPRPARRQAIVLLIASYLVAGIAAQVYPAVATLRIGFFPIMTVVTTALAYWWYWADSKLTGYERSTWLNAGVLAFSVLGVLYYVVRSRRGRDRLQVSFSVIGVAVLALVLNQLGGLTAFAAVRTQNGPVVAAGESEAKLGASTTEICGTEVEEGELRPVSRQPPVYPLIAQFYGIEGFIELAVTVAPDGRVASHKVIKEEPDGLFEGAAADALEQWRYCPFDDGDHENKEKKIRLRFDLED